MQDGIFSILDENVNNFGILIILLVCKEIIILVKVSVGFFSDFIRTCPYFTLFKLQINFYAFYSLSGTGYLGQVLGKKD